MSSKPVELKKQIKPFLFLALAFLITTHFSSNAFAQETKRPMQPADILRIANVSDAQISPDGKYAAYTVTAIENGESKTRLWLAGTDGKSSGAQLLLSQDWTGSTPRWSPDSKRIAFSASKDGKSGIWFVTLEDRTPRFIVEVKQAGFYIAYAGESFAWSPDSKRIAFISAAEEPDTTADEKSTDPRVITRIQYKTRTGFSDRMRTHVFVVDGDGQNLKQLTSGKFYDHAITWNPNGEEIAFLSNRTPNPEAVNNSDIFAVDMNAKTRRITDTKGCEYDPQWSPDGKWIAYTATKREVTTIDSIAEDTHVWVIDAKGGTGKELNGKQDRRSRNPRWRGDSKAVFFLVTDRGEQRICLATLDGKKIKHLEFLQSYTVKPRVAEEIDVSVDNYISPVPKPGDSRYFPRSRSQVTSYSVSVVSPLTSSYKLGVYNISFVNAPRLAFTITDPIHLNEIWISAFADGLTGRISTHNDKDFSIQDLVYPDEISFNSFDNTPIQGWLMKPANFQEGKKYPLILAIHGGPHGAYGYSFQPNFQVYAARGYAVLFLNPRGSNGYGQKFSDGCVRDWGGGDYKDLMAGVDYVLKKYSWIDGERMGVTGGSYGGYMTLWVVSQTNRFKAAVALASVSNLISFYSTSLYQDLIHAEFGLPWDNYDLLWERSPLKWVKNVKTPTQLQHGENDNDVHITQAEEFYTALAQRGVAAELVRYPRAGHGFRESKHRVDSLERILVWFDKYLK